MDISVHFWKLLSTSGYFCPLLEALYTFDVARNIFIGMKKTSLPDLEKLKTDRSPYLDVEIAANRVTIDRARSSGYRLKTIWRSLFNSGDITGTYSGFLKALRRNGFPTDHVDNINVGGETMPTKGSRSDRESEAAMAEAREVLARRAKAK